MRRTAIAAAGLVGLLSQPAYATMHQGDWQIGPGTHVIHVGWGGEDSCDAPHWDFRSTSAAVLCLATAACFDSFDQPPAQVVIELDRNYPDKTYAHLPLQSGMCGAVGRMAVILDGGGSTAYCGCGWVGGLDLFFSGTRLAIQNGYIAEISLSEGAEAIMNAGVGVGITLGDAAAAGNFWSNVLIERGSTMLWNPGNGPAANVNVSACGPLTMFALSEGGILEVMGGPPITMTGIGGLDCSDAVVMADALSYVGWGFTWNGPEPNGTAYKFYHGSRVTGIDAIPGSLFGAVEPR